MNDGLVDRLLAVIGESPAVRAVGRELLTRYAEPQRRYHTAEHLSEMFAALDVLVGRVPPAVACAVWWHDAVYDPPASDNEERSADLARWQLTELGAGSDLVEETVRLVRLTAGHAPAEEDAAGQLLSDADLAILAAPPDRYRRYVADVRREYAHVDEPAWRAGRAAVLRGLLDGGLFHTDLAQAWTAAARRNVTAELDDLGG